MNILILTVGQSDLQLVTNKEFNSFDKTEMRAIHTKLNKLMKQDKLKWKSSQLLNEEKHIKKIKSIKDKKEVYITFPIIENLFKYFKEDNIKIDKIYFFYTNRYKYKNEINERFFNGEPYLTHEIFNSFYDEIASEYQLDIANVEYINIGENIYELRRFDKIYPFFDGKFKKLKKENPTKLYIALAGGISSIGTVIGDLITLYFPDKSVFLEQSFNKIEMSKFHKLKRYYRNYYLLENNIKNWDFFKASKSYNNVSENNEKTLIYKILDIVNKILLGNENLALEELKKIFEKKLFSKSEQKRLENIINVIKNKEGSASFIVYIKFLHIYKLGNYWAATTILVTLLEVLTQEMIESSCKGIKTVYNNKSAFDLKRISNIDKFQRKKGMIFLDEDNNIILNNWSAINVILNHLNKYEKSKFSKLKKIINNMEKIKKMRNNFIHKGFSISKSELDVFLDISTSKNNENKFFNSLLLKEIFNLLNKENKDIKYFNWLEFFEKLLLKSIKGITPKN